MTELYRCFFDNMTSFKHEIYFYCMIIIKVSHSIFMIIIKYIVCKLIENKEGRL